MWQIDEFFWPRSWLCLWGITLVITLLALTCSRTWRPRAPRREPSWHLTKRGPAL
jgi:hypothetical protein